MMDGMVENLHYPKIIEALTRTDRLLPHFKPSPRKALSGQGAE